VEKREMDEQIFERVFQAKKVPGFRYDRHGSHQQLYDCGGMPEAAPFFTTSPRDSAMLREKIRELGFEWRLQQWEDGHFSFSIARLQNMETFSADGDTEGEAQCLCALKIGGG